MFKIKTAKFITSALNITKTPPDNAYPEVAVMGRSNVGKSSLLCSLTNHKKLAKVSQTPGKTRLINYFLIDDAWYLVDLPGYGYAKVPESEKARWGKMIERYLRNSAQLKQVFLLVDIRHEPGKNDIQMFNWILNAGYEPVVIATKLDKIKKSQLAKQKKLIRETLGMRKDELLIPFSAQTKEGREDIYAVLESYLEPKSE